MAIGKIQQVPAGAGSSLALFAADESNANYSTLGKSKAFVHDAR